MPSAITAALTPPRLAQSELRWLLEECAGGLELDEYGFVQYYRRTDGTRAYFEPTWNSFDHPLHNLTRADQDVTAVAALQIVTTVLRTLFS